MSETKAKDRMLKLDPETDDPALRAQIERLMAGRGRIPTPYNIWLHVPRLAEGMEIIGTHLDSASVMSEAEVEIGILSTAVFWGTPYVMANHIRHALKAGVPADVVTAIVERRRPECEDTRLQAVCDLTAALLAGGAVEDPAFEAFDQALGRAVIGEMIMLIGYYSSVCVGMRLHNVQPKASQLPAGFSLG